jgi:3-deoxy-D-manno-octulosonic-acid transferase
MFNFAEASRYALEAGAAVQAKDAAGAMREALRLLANAGERERMGAAGKNLCAAHRGATQKHLLLCEELLDPAAPAAVTGPERG